MLRVFASRLRFSPSRLRPANPRSLKTHPVLGPILLPSSPPKGDSTNTRLAFRAAQQIGIETTRVSSLNDPARPEGDMPGRRDPAIQGSKTQHSEIAVGWVAWIEQGECRRR